MTSDQPASASAPIAFDVCVVGAGAAGIMAALEAAAKGCSVVLLEKEERIGKKILISGGGKCNLTNIRVSPSNFHGSHPRFAADALRGFDEGALVAWIERLGVPTFADQETGKVWPRALKSIAVTDALSDALARAKVKLLLRRRVVSVAASEQGFTLGVQVGLPRGDASGAMPQETTITCRSLVLATGGCAAPQLGADTSGLDMAAALGHKLVPHFPALAGLVTVQTWGQALAGVTCESVRLTLDGGGKKLAESEGSLLFTHYGVTSPAVFRVSREVGPALADGQTVRLLVNWRADLFDSEKTARTVVEAALAANSKKHLGTVMGDMLGIRRLADALVREAGGDPDSRVRELQHKQRENLIGLLWRCPFDISATQGWEKAEVMRGGVDVRGVNPKTMESRTVAGLFICGEMLDMDADVGGYNFQFAFASGKAAGHAAAKRCKAALA